MDIYYARVGSDGAVIEHSIREDMLRARGVDLRSVVPCSVLTCQDPRIDQRRQITVVRDVDRVRVMHWLTDISYEEILGLISRLSTDAVLSAFVVDQYYKAFWIMTRKQLNHSLDTYAKSLDFLDFNDLVSHEDSTVETLKQKALNAICLRDQMVMVMLGLIQDIRNGASVPESYQELYGRMLKVMEEQAHAE